MVKFYIFKGVTVIKSLFKAVALLSIFSILTRCLSFVYRIFLSRTLTNSTLGIYTIALSVFGIFNTLLASGTPLTISKLVSTNPHNNKENGRVVTAGFIINITASILLTVFVLLFKSFFGLFFTDETSYVILLTMIPAILSTGFYTSFRGYLYGKEKYLHIGVVELIEQILRIVLCVILIIFLFPENSPVPAGISFGVAGVLSTIIGVCVYFKVGGKIGNPKGYFSNIIKTSLPITFVRIGGSLIVPLISILIPLRLVSAGFTNEYALSQIGIIMGMTLPLLTIPSTIIGAFSTALIPRTALSFRQKDYDGMNKEVMSSLNFSLILTFLLIPPFIALGEPTCKFIFNSEQAGIYLSMSAWLMIPMCFTQISTSVLNAIGEEHKSFWIYLFASIFLLASVWFLPKYIGATSIVIGMGISSTITTILNMRLISKQSNLSHSYVKLTTFLLLLSIPITLLTKFLFNIFIQFMPLFLSLAITSILSVGLFFILLSLFNILNVQSFMEIIKNRLRVKSLKLRKKNQKV